MLYRMFPLVTLALAMFVASPVLVAKDTAESADVTHDGKVVSVTGDKLVMSNKEGKEHSHTLSKDAKVTCDAKPCKVGDLKAGMKIRVTTKGDDKQIATHVEAIDKNQIFANTHDGKVVSIAGDKLMMADTDGKEHSHMIAANATITCDGKDCKRGQLKTGMKIRVTNRTNDKNVLTVIEALDKDAEFGS